MIVNLNNTYSLTRNNMTEMINYDPIECPLKSLTIVEDKELNIPLDPTY